MGRKPSANANLPPLMRKRAQRSGKVFYYLDTRGRPRREIPLGDDYILALRKYAELHETAAPVTTASFDALVSRYLKEMEDGTLKLSRNTTKTHTSDMKHLVAFFNCAPLEDIRPMDIKKFLDKHKGIPTTANRCKRLFSTLWNHARGWGYTDLENPCTGIRGHSLEKRTVYVTDQVFAAVYAHASEPLRDALDMAYLTGQRPGDAVKMRVDDIEDGRLRITQGKTGKRLRVSITGELAELLARIAARKAQHTTLSGSLLVGSTGKPLTLPALRYQFDQARAKAAAGNPDLDEAIKAMWFYDLRAKAADDTSDERGEQAASDLLGHDNVKTTQRHYLRRGKIVVPTK
ncbi:MULTISPECIES: tyrosine-type recombinase/integrase [unclassified Janthinobacterium]|uniref:tyrosine-type recombinase/integrase n=1 Tax=unclassified Janthinobacterium TaxID=2610881 RepID=UPI000345B267|nr:MULTISPECIES: tyrosine-type recombinase/integrase [unclassified Janthinobacterium]MEC5161682.1 integrase [Janthinobacterium sp. CG_S6]